MLKNNVFLKRQYLQFKKQNFYFFLFSKFLKLIKMTVNMIIYILILPIFFIVYIISFFYPIRFGQVNNNVIGHYLFDVEYYLSYKKKNKIQSLDFFYFVSNNSSNIFWDKIVKRHLKISHIFKYFFVIANFVSKKNLVALNHLTVRDINDVLYSTPVQIKFSKKEVSEGLNSLTKMGKRSNQKYICIVNRDSAYRDKYFKDAYASDVINDSFDYHTFRNSNIDDYTQAIEYFLDKGFFVIRMGKTVEKKLIIKNKNFIDYANSEFRSDFLDIFLFSHSHLNIVSESGILLSSMIFRKPMCSINCAELGGLQTWHDKNIIIFKKYWNKKKNKFLSIDEILNLSKFGINSHILEKRNELFKKWKKNTSKNLYISFNNFLKKKKLSKILKLNKEGKVLNNKDGLPIGNYGLFEVQRHQDIEVIDNSPQEIKAVCEELEKKISENWKNTYEEEKLQNVFWDKFPKTLYSHGIIRSRIGNNFLKKNNFLLN